MSQVSMLTIYMSYVIKLFGKKILKSWQLGVSCNVLEKGTVPCFLLNLYYSGIVNGPDILILNTRVKCNLLKRCVIRL